MGGEIVVESIPDKGSDFSVFLHLPVAERPAGRQSVGRGRTSERSGEQDAFRGRRILMAEDNELNAMIAKEILESMGAAVDVAGDGQKAVDSFASIRWIITILS